MSGTYCGGDLIAEFLERCGIETAFGITSVHNVPILDAIGRGNAIRFVMARGEMGAGHMADAYARVTGKMAALITSTGPGAANAVPALMEARAAWTPMLHITGQTPTKFAGRGMGTTHDVPDQIGMLRSVCKAAYHVGTSQELFETLVRAAGDAQSMPRGPVSVEIPIDIQRAPVTRPTQFDHFSLSLTEPRTPSQSDIDRLVGAVVAARRPMIWLGSGARGAREPASRLLDLGFRAVSSWAGRGAVPENDPRSLGTVSGLGMPVVEEFYQTVDLMIIAGSRLRGQETFDFTLKLPRALVQIDLDANANNRTYPLKDFVQGECHLVLSMLADAVAGQMSIDPAFAGEFANVRDCARQDYRASLGPYASFPDQVRAAMPAGAAWVRDATIANSSWGHRLMPVSHPSENVYPICAAIGVGLPFGIGAAVANTGKQKTVVLSGDGGFALNLTELWTAVQEGLDIVMIIMNDSGYGVIKHIQDALYGGRHFFVNLEVPDIAGIARLAGIAFRKVTECDALEPALKEALDIAGPTLIEVDVAAIGPIPPYFPYNRVQQRAG